MNSAMLETKQFNKQSLLIWDGNLQTHKSKDQLSHFNQDTKRLKD